MNDITNKLAEALRRTEACMTNDGVGKQAREALRLYEQAKPAEPVAWRTFDGEGGYEYRSYADNEDYASEWAKRNPKHVGWVEALYAAPVAQAEQWQPIETAPKDGTRILVGRASANGDSAFDSVGQANWRIGIKYADWALRPNRPAGFYWASDDARNGQCGGYVTHWMPLPQPPRTRP